MNGLCTWKIKMACRAETPGWTAVPKKHENGTKNGKRAEDMT